MLVGQNIGLPFVVPLALEILERDVLVEASYFRGDLLAATLQADSSFFEGNPDLRSRVEKLIAAIPAALEGLDHINFDTSSEALEEAIAEFRG